MARKQNGAQKEPTERELKKIAKAEEKAYYEEAKTWEAELYRSARGRARVWAWIAGLSLHTGLFTSRPMGDGKGKTASTTVEQGRLIPKMDRTIQRKQFGTCQIWRQ